MCTTCQQIEYLKERVSTLEKENEQIVRLFTEIKNAQPKEVMSVKEAAKLLHKSAYTVSEWCRAGKIKSTREGKDGMYMITHTAIQNFINKS